MAKDNIFVDTKELDKLAIGLKGLEKQMPGASASALNRTVDFIYTRIGRLVTQEYSIKITDVKKTIKKYKAKKGDLSAKLVSKGHTLSLAHFSFSPKKPGTRRQVKVKIKRGKSKPVGVDPKAFVASTGAKSADKVQYNVFKRTTNKRLPVVVLRTLSVPQMIGNANVEAQIQEAAQKKLGERIEHEINWRLDKLKKQLKG